MGKISGLNKLMDLQNLITVKFLNLYFDRLTKFTNNVD